VKGKKVLCENGAFLVDRLALGGNAALEARNAYK
jgi:hypothetical protein